MDNLSTVLDGVQDSDMDYSARWLHIPDSNRDELKQRYDSIQVKRALAEYFIKHHPAPSWTIVATALWINGESEALEVVQKLYLKGEPCEHSCRSEERILSVSECI